MRGIAALSPSNHWHPKTHNNPSTHPAKNLKPNPLRLINNNPSTKRLNPMPSFTIKASQTHNPTTPPLVVVGSANADIYVEIDRLPREGETISAKTGQTLAGGKGANQAVCGGKLSYPTFFVGQIGCGVVLERLRNVSGAPTGHAVVMLQSDGQNSIIIVGGANMSCWPDAMCDEDLELVRNAGIVLLQREIPDFVNIQVAKGVRQVLVKLGAKGAALFLEGEEPVKQPIISAPRVLDTTGAGDTFTAAFAVALVEGKSKKECLRFAAAAASLCVQVKGAIPSMPDRKSVLNLLQSL
ncbi:hypothetical protein CsSME_00018959 [Camellia sinensis var. sinensis]